MVDTKERENNEERDEREREKKLITFLLLFIEMWKKTGWKWSFPLSFSLLVWWDKKLFDHKLRNDYKTLSST